MLLLLKEIRRHLWLLLFSAAAFEFCRYAIKSNTHMEMNYYIFPIIFCAMLFTRTDEIELIQTTRTRLSTVLALRYSITYLFFVLYPVLRLIITQQGRAGRISISLATTLLFCTSISMVVRILIRNHYGAVISSVVVHVLLIAIIEGILGRYFIPQTVRRLSPYYPDGIQNIYLYINNRLITAGLGVLVIAAAFFLIYKREKLLTG